jgi:hypothetical protein
MRRNPFRRKRRIENHCDGLKEAETLHRKIVSFNGVLVGVLLVGLSMVAGCASAPATWITSCG